MKYIDMFIIYFTSSVRVYHGYFQILAWSKCRDVLFEFHLKFWNTASIGIPVRSLL